MGNNRRDNIFQASLEEFAAVDYERANTNHICEIAEVSKGLLFHYYGSKKHLYLYTVEKCIEDVLAAFDGFLCSTNWSFGRAYPVRLRLPSCLP